MIATSIALMRWAAQPTCPNILLLVSDDHTWSGHATIVAGKYLNSEPCTPRPEFDR